MFRDVLDELLNAAGYAKLADANDNLPNPYNVAPSGADSWEPVQDHSRLPFPTKGRPSNKQPMKGRNEPQETPPRRGPNFPAGDPNDPNETPTPVGPRPGMGL